MKEPYDERDDKGEEEMGLECHANVAHPQLSTPLMPIIGKLCVHV